MIPAYRSSSARLVRDPQTGRWHYARPMAEGYRGTGIQGYRFGTEIGAAAAAPSAQQPPLQAQATAEESFSMADLSKAFTHAITPTLIVVGIATGAAFAIGSGLVSRYLFKDRG